MLFSNAKWQPPPPPQVYTLAGQFVRSVYGHRKVSGLRSASVEVRDGGGNNVVLVFVVEANSSLVSILE